MEELLEKVEKQYAAFPPKLRRKIKFSPSLNIYNNPDDSTVGRIVRIAFEFPESPIGKGSLKDLINAIKKNSTEKQLLEFLKELSDNMTRIQYEEEGAMEIDHGGRRKRSKRSLGRRGRKSRRKTLRQRK